MIIRGSQSTLDDLFEDSLQENICCVQGIVQKLKWNVPIREPCAPSLGFMPRANALSTHDD